MLSHFTVKVSLGTKTSANVLKSKIQVEMTPLNDTTPASNSTSSINVNDRPFKKDDMFNRHLP